MTVDTTRDTTGRVLLLKTARVTHWGNRSEPKCGVVLMAAEVSYGSAAAITCALCRRAWAREQQG